MVGPVPCRRKLTPASAHVSSNRDAGRSKEGVNEDVVIEEIGAMHQSDDGDNGVDIPSTFISPRKSKEKPKKDVSSYDLCKEGFFCSFFRFDGPVPVDVNSEN